MINPNNPSMVNGQPVSFLGNPTFNQQPNNIPTPAAPAPAVSSAPQPVDPASQQLMNYIQQYNTAMTPGGSQAGTNAYVNSPNFQAQFGNTMQNVWNSSPLQNLGQINNVAGMNNVNAPNMLSLQDFLGSGAYQTMYGNNNSTDPNQRFQNDPGVQRAIQAGLPLLANSYAQRGLGASGPAAEGMMDYMYKNYNDFVNTQGNLYNQTNTTNLANQVNNQNANIGINQFNAGAINQANQLNAQTRLNNYLGQQQLLGNNFNNYQGQLANAANMGAQASNQLSSNYYNSGQNLMQLLNQGFLGTGNNLANLGMTSAGNIAGLLANQGVLNANAYLGVGSAMSNNMMQGSLLGAQLANAQNASNAGTMNSFLQGQGANNSLYGVNSMFGGGY